MRRIHNVGGLLALVLLCTVCKKPPVGHPPATPSAPAGISNGGYNTSYQFTAFTADPDSDSVAIRFSWGDGDTSTWSAWVASGETVAQAHSWPSAGSYQVKAQAKDRSGNTSDWSASLAVTITTNQAPSTPAIPTGPATAPKDSGCFFTSITTDPDGDGVSYRFSWGNGDTSEWGGWTQSGTTGAAMYAYPRSGAFQVRAQARDANEARSSWSDPCQVSILNPSPPNTPSTPTGPSNGKPHTTYSFSSHASDPRGDSVSVRFAWGLGDTSNWSSLAPSGQQFSMNHAWNDTGSFQINAQARDEDGATSAWSNSHQVVLANRAPYSPSKPTGPSEGGRNISETFCASATDPDGDSVALRFDWGDGDTSDWSTLVSSGDSVRSSHAWVVYATYQIRAQARDKDGLTSGWSSPAAFTANRFRWRYWTGSEIRSSPGVASGGDVYFGCNDSFVYSLTSSGNLKWRYRTSATVTSSPAISDDGTIYVGADVSYLYAFTADGSVKWRRSTGGSVTSPAIAADGTVYIGSYDGYLYAVAPDNTLKWRYQTGRAISSAPAVGPDGTVYVVSNDLLHAVNADGALLWERGGFYGGVSDLAIASDGTVYFTTIRLNDADLHAFGADGTVFWHYRLTSGASNATSPTVASDGTIYVGVALSLGGGDYLYAVYPAGALRWRRDVTFGTSPTIAADGTMYVGGYDLLVAIDPSGSGIWSYFCGRVLSNPAVGTDGTILFGTDGYLYAIQGDSPLGDTPWPKFHHDNKNTGRVGGGR